MAASSGHILAFPDDLVALVSAIVLSGPDTPLSVSLIDGIPPEIALLLALLLFSPIYYAPFIAWLAQEINRMEEVSSFGDWVRRRRKALDLTQAELAQQVNCATVTVRKIESDALRPSRQIADRLAHCLAIPREKRNIFLQVARAERLVEHLPSPIELAQAETPTIAPGTSNNLANLPAALTSFIGREHELTELARLSTISRLVTLTGVGGVGKTRLALRVASEVRHLFPDGIWLSELAPVVDVRFIAQAVASTFTIRETAGDLLLTTLCANLRDKHLLLILDNCEHLLAGCADLVDTLLRTCPRLSILATSREPLNLLGEQLYPIQPLAAPASGQVYTSEDLARVESVSLFCDRVRTSIPTFTMTAENTQAIADLCRRLDGLPLAIELAAAQIRLRPPQALLEHSPLATLINGPRNLPSRQQTLRTTIDWSYRLLDRYEQQLFNCLGIFAGGWTTEAAAAICGAIGDPAVPAGLAALHNKNLVYLVEDAPDQPRFAMLETIRAYALEQLAATGQTNTLRQQHGAYYLALVEWAEEQFSGPRARAVLDSLEREHENLRAVLSWVLEPHAGNSGRLELAFRLCGALWRFWWMRGFLQEGRYWIERALAAPERVAPHLRAKVLQGSGVLARAQGDFARATACLTESLALWKAQDNKPGMADALNSLGVIHFNQRDYSQAQALFQASCALYRALGNSYRVAMILNNLGNIAQKQADFVQASQLYEEALSLLERRANNPQLLAVIKMNLGEVARVNKNYIQAARLTCESGFTYLEINEIEGLLYCLNNLASIAVDLSHWAIAAQLLGAAGALYEQTGVARSPDQVTDYEEHTTAIRDHIGEALFEQHRYEARSLTIVDLFRRTLHAIVA